MAAHELDQLFVTNPTTEHFQVKWDGAAYAVPPGQKLIYPRFIAEHFAKHLTDKILLQKEVAYERDNNKSRPFLNDRLERPKVINSIIVGVYSHHRPNANSAETLIAQQIEDVNARAQRNEKVLDIGTVDDSLVGALRDYDDQDDDPALAASLGLDPLDSGPRPAQQTSFVTVNTDNNTVVPPVGKPKPTRSELFAEAKRLDIEVKSNMTNDQIEALIKQF